MIRWGGWKPQPAAEQWFNGHNVPCNVSCWVDGVCASFMVHHSVFTFAMSNVSPVRPFRVSWLQVTDFNIVADWCISISSWDRVHSEPSMMWFVNLSCCFNRFQSPLMDWRPASRPIAAGIGSSSPSKDRQRGEFMNEWYSTASWSKKNNSRFLYCGGSVHRDTY